MASAYFEYRESKFHLFVTIAPLDSLTFDVGLYEPIDVKAV